MPSNKCIKQTIQVKMKQQPLKRKSSTKTTAQDSVSETISFVIKGKLTPIKPSCIPEKVRLRKQVMKVDKKLSVSSMKGNNSYKKSVLDKIKIENEDKLGSKKVKKVVRPKNVNKSQIEVLIEETPSKIMKSKISNKTSNKPISKKTLKKEQVLKPQKLSETVSTEKKSDTKHKKSEVKKKKPVAKLLKQGNESFGTNQILKTRRQGVIESNNKPKKELKIVGKKRNVTKTKSNKIREPSSHSQEELKTESQEPSLKEPEQSSNLSNIEKDDSVTSDDANLEEIRQSLKKELLVAKTKPKNQNECDKSNKSPEQSKEFLNKKQRKVIESKIKKARLEDHKLRKLKLYGFWNGPKRKRVASLNAIAKVHCLYENEGRLSLLDNLETLPVKKEVEEKIETKASPPPPQRSLRYVPGLRGVGKHWDMHDSSSSSSDENSDDGEVINKKITKIKKEPPKKVVENKTQPKRKRKQNDIVMDLKDMVVRKRMASLNATAILAASYSQEKRIPRSPKTENAYDSDSSDDSIDDEEPRKKKCYADDVKKEDKLIEVQTKPNKKVAVIVNQDTDVTITGVYVNSTTRSTHHEGYCSIAGMQYRISATSHTQTAATAVATETLLQSSSTSSSQENTKTETLTPTGKSYKPLDALSNMRPPSDGAHHGHQTMAPPQHVMPLSPSGVRHSCSSAFTAPHHTAYHHSGPRHHGPAPPTMKGEPGYIHGYYQPAGPLITVPFGHGQPPLAKSAPLSETSPSTPSPLSSHPPHPAPSSNGGDSSDSEVIITSVTAGKDVPPPQAHSTYRYSQYPTNVPPPSYSYPYSSHYYHPTPPPPNYPPHNVCYSPGPYVHPTFRRYLGGPQYYPSNPPSTQELYAVPPTHAQPSQQVVTAAPASGTGSSYQPAVCPPPSSALLDSYPPTLVESYPAHYFPGYQPGPQSSCYSHAPPPRAVPFINGAYQSCPCPMQSCPKNGLTGPLTGDSKRSSTLPKGSMPPLRPVALALPEEPPSDGPPSPARGSAGMPPPPSPAGATYQQQPTPPTKQESISPESIPIEKKRRARVGKAMVRSNMQNTMLLMCHPIPANCVKREIESPKEKEIVIVPVKEDVALNNIDSKISEEFENPLPQSIEKESATQLESTPVEPPVKIEEKPMEQTKEEEEDEILEPVISTVGENVKVKNMKRKLSLSLERKEEVPAVSPPKMHKIEVKSNGSYKDLIKKKTSSIRINNGKRKLIQESRIPHRLLSRATVLNRRKAQNKRKLCSSRASRNNTKSKLLRMSNSVLTNNNIEKNINKIDEEDVTLNPAEIKEKRNHATTQINAKSNQKLAALMLDNLIAKNNVDRTIESVISDALRTSLSKKTDNVKNVKEVKEPSVPTTDIVKKSTRKAFKHLTNRRKSKCKDSATKVAASIPVKVSQLLRWSNGWSWEGEPYEAKVFLNSDETTVIRKCYPSMRHHSGDLIEARDCVLLKAGARRNELPFVAKIAALWENPDDGEMMMSLLWYYRPEHTEQGRLPVDQPDEVFASRHKDSNSVACIDDKCFVLTFNEYCRYRKSLRRIDEGIEEQISSCIPLPETYPRSHRQPPHDMKISAEMVFFCRRVYDFRQKRIIKNPT